MDEQRLVVLLHWTKFNRDFFPCVKGTVITEFDIQRVGPVVNWLACPPQCVGVGFNSGSEKTKY